MNGRPRQSLSTCRILEFLKKCLMILSTFTDLGMYPCILKHLKLIIKFYCSGETTSNKERILQGNKLYTPNLHTIHIISITYLIQIIFYQRLPAFSGLPTMHNYLENLLMLQSSYNCYSYVMRMLNFFRTKRYCVI